MKSKDPKTGFTFDFNLDPRMMEWIQDELADVPEAEMDRLRVLRAAVHVHAGQMCAIGDTARCRAYLELVVGHFIGARLCAECGGSIGPTAEHSGPGISHGYCPGCETRLNAMMDALDVGSDRDQP
ncbi:hypothetical protein LCGC14_0259030 [marine sediment metagenome]|uniref:Uncharacterized protein n=1 Tax=marine sediment metagenome TaxID=412755 RepID=A0A0F9X797_9ZZZZ